MFIRSPDQIAVHGNREVRPFSHDTARRKGICFSVLFRHGIMVDHGIHIAGRNQKGKSGFPTDGDAFVIFPIRLGNESDFVSGIFEEPCDNGSSEGWMVYVGIAGNVDKVCLFPAPLSHLYSIRR